MTVGGWHRSGLDERRLDAALDDLDGAHVLHDRRLPQTKTTIDHLVVAATGVWVIAAKRHAGAIRRIDDRVRVGRRDRTKLLDIVHYQVGYVVSALSLLDLPRPAVHGVLCFIDGEFGLAQPPFTLDGVLVTWDRSLRKELNRPGPLERDDRGIVHRALAAAFPPAR